MSHLPEARNDEDAIPHGVELLMDTPEIEARITYIRRNMRDPFVIPNELRRLVNEVSRRELVGLGVIKPGTPR